jgi:divalent metal cation (Fe/Co/Zn/Cd) transporter
VLLTGAVIVAILRYASTGQQIFFAYTWIWVLLIGGFVNVLVLQHLRGRGGDTSSDAYALRKLTFLPASLWSGVFWLGTLVAFVYGAGILLGMVHIGR